MAGLFAKGTSIWVGTEDSPTSMVKIGSVKTITGPGVQVMTVKTTTHDTEGNWEEIAAVLLSGGKISFPVNYDPSEGMLDPMSGLWDDMINLRERYYELRFPPSDDTHTMFSFIGFVTGHPFSFPVDNIIEATIEITPDGAITPGTFTP